MYEGTKRVPDRRADVCSRVVGRHGRRKAGGGGGIYVELRPAVDPSADRRVVHEILRTRQGILGRPHRDQVLPERTARQSRRKLPRHAGGKPRNRRLLPLSDADPRRLRPEHDLDHRELGRDAPGLPPARRHTLPRDEGRLRRGRGAHALRLLPGRLRPGQQQAAHPDDR